MSELIEVFYKYRSCSGIVHVLRFTIAVNLTTGEQQPVFKMIPIVTGDKHRTITCSKTWHYMAHKEDLRKLEAQGYIFKNIVKGRKGLREVTYWALTKKVEYPENGRDKEGWYDLIEVDGKRYKVYKNKVVAL